MNNDHSTPYQKTTHVYNENLPIRTKNKTHSQKCTAKCSRTESPKNIYIFMWNNLVLTVLNWLH